MPEISRFLGIIIRMYLREHAPPHFQEELMANWQAAIDRKPLSKIEPLE